MMSRKVLLLTFVLLAVLTIGQRQIDAQGESGASLRANGDAPYWPSFGYDPQNTSRSPHPGPQTGQLAWTYEAPKGRVINNQPTVDADGTGYFAINGFYIPWKVAEVEGIDTPEELEAYLLGDKVPYFTDLGAAWGRVHPGAFGSFAWGWIDPDFFSYHVYPTTYDLVPLETELAAMKALVGERPHRRQANSTMLD